MSFWNVYISCRCSFSDTLAICLPKWTDDDDDDDGDDDVDLGIQLRKVEHRQQSEQKKQMTGKLDVQTIMEAAFERRRHAIEENDSDRDDEDEGDWDDDAWS